MNKTIYTFLILLKWIFLTSLIFNSAQAKEISQNELKLVKIENYISDYEEYNEQIINTKKNPSKRPPTSNTIARESINKISKILMSEMFLKKDKSDRLATIISFSAKKYDIDPRIMIAIMKIESNFDQNAVNLESCQRSKKIKCGDYSIAQINYEVWSVSFIRLGRKPLDLQRLKTDETYAIFRMGEILDILKKQYAKVDPYWFARYHSSTPEHKNRYKVVLRKELRKVIALGPNLLKNFPSSKPRAIITSSNQ